MTYTLLGMAAKQRIGTSSAIDDLKAFILRHGGARFVDQTAAAIAGNADVKQALALEQAVNLIEMRLRGVPDAMAAGLAIAFAALVRERLARP
jgi:hypothetical protein